MEEIEFLDISEAAEVIRCSKGHVYNLIAAGKLRRFDIGLKRPKTRVAKADVQAYAQAAEVPVPTAGDAA